MIEQEAVERENHLVHEFREDNKYKLLHRIFSKLVTIKKYLLVMSLFFFFIPYFRFSIQRKDPNGRNKKNNT